MNKFFKQCADPTISNTELSIKYLIETKLLKLVFYISALIRDFFWQILKIGRVVTLLHVVYLGVGGVSDECEGDMI